MLDIRGAVDLGALESWCVCRRHSQDADPGGLLAGHALPTTRSCDADECSAGLLVFPPLRQGSLSRSDWVRFRPIFRERGVFFFFLQAESFSEELLPHFSVPSPLGQIKRDSMFAAPEERSSHLHTVPRNPQGSGADSPSRVAGVSYREGKPQAQLPRRPVVNQAQGSPSSAPTPGLTLWEDNLKEKVQSLWLSWGCRQHQRGSEGEAL